MELTGPHLLATLPRSTNVSHGKYHGGLVRSISDNGILRKRRTEVLVGIDGEALNIYSVVNGRLKASHAIAPHHSLITSPLTLYTSNSTHPTVRRWTYAAVVDQAKPQDITILSFKSDLKPVQSSSQPRTSEKSCVLSAFGSEVILLDTFQSAQATNQDLDSSPSFFILEKNGKFGILDDSLQISHSTRIIWDYITSHPKTRATSQARIEYGKVLSLEQAANGLLKNRQDLYSSASKSGASSLLFIVASKPGSVDTFDLHLIAMPSSNDTLLRGQSSSLQHLTTWTLETHDQVSSDNYQAQFYLDERNGRLHCGSSTFKSFNLTEVTPSKLTEIRLPGKSCESFVHLVSDCFAIVSNGTCEVIDAHYGVSLHTLNCSSDKSQQNNSQQATNTISSLELFEVFPRIGIIVALSGNSLITINDTSAAAAKASKAFRPSLADVIGKGPVSEKLHTRIPHVSRPQSINKFFTASSLQDFHESNFKKRLGKLDEAAAAGDTALFSSRFLNMLEAKVYGSNDSSKADTRKLSWDVYHKTAVVDFSQTQEEALYAVKKLFSGSAEKLTNGHIPEERDAEHAMIKISFFPVDVFKWLLLSGHLNDSTLRNALDTSAYLPEDHDYMKEVIKALSQYDPSMRYLDELVRCSRFLDATEALTVAKILIQSLENTKQANSPHSDDTPMMNGTNSDTAPAADQEKEEQIADEELSYAIARLEDGPQIRGQALRYALMRAWAFSSTELTRSMREILTDHELIFLIHLLRIEVADGGWTDIYADSFPSSSGGESSSPANQAIIIIADLLSSAIQAIGTTGWLFGSFNQHYATDELLDSLREEISATLEGVQQCISLGSMATALLQFDTHLQQEQDQIAHSNLHRLSRFHTDVSANAPPVSLPMAYNAKRKLDEDRTTLAGETRKKSKKLMYDELNRHVGRYSFQRIRLQ